MHALMDTSGHKLALGRAALIVPSVPRVMAVGENRGFSFSPDRASGQNGVKVRLSSQLSGNVGPWISKRLHKGSEGKAGGSKRVYSRLCNKIPIPA